MNLVCTCCWTDHRFGCVRDYWKARWPDTWAAMDKEWDTSKTEEVYRRHKKMLMADLEYCYQTMGYK